MTRRFAPPARAAVDACLDGVYRDHWRNLTLVLARRFGTANLDLIESALQAASVKAIDAWPFQGLPGNPAGWLLQVARNQVIDTLRRRAMQAGKAAAVAEQLYADVAVEPVSPDPLDDDALTMMFVCCHPDLKPRESIALTLQVICGLRTREIARAMLTGDEALRKTITRTKAKIRDKAIPFETPPRTDLAARLDRVLQIVYLLFNEGYTAHVGDNLVRRDLCNEALRIASLILASNLPDKGRVYALAALMAFQAARLPARIDADGRLLRLAEQDRTLWDRDLIARGMTCLERSMTGTERSGYHLQAAIAACHAAAPSYDATDWPRIRAFYDDLRVLTPSPVVELNRAVAVAMTDSPAAGLAILDRLDAEDALPGEHLLPSLQADFHRRLGDAEAAGRYYRRALDQVQNVQQRRFLLRQIDTVGHW